MTTKQTIGDTEFNEIRSAMYERAINEFPLAREMDLEAMQNHLSPTPGEYILGIGEGNGFFCNAILSAIGKGGKYVVIEPSKFQLNNLKNRVNVSQLEVITSSAESMPIKKDYYDKIWSFGAFHHCPNQTEAMKRMYQSLKYGGELVICEVFQGSKLAEHFDSQVARYCNTGHEVKFLSDAFAKSLCYLAGFRDEDVKIEELPQKWVFESEQDLGKFMYNLHAMIFLPGDETTKFQSVLNGCKEILGVTKNAYNQYELNWPMKVMKVPKRK